MINETIKPNPSLHVWFDAPGIWDELVHITDPDMGKSSELRLAAEYLMTRKPEEIELVGWMVMQDDAIWDSINISIQEAIMQVASDLQRAEEQVLSSDDGQNQPQT